MKHGHDLNLEVVNKFVSRLFKKRILEKIRYGKQTNKFNLLFVLCQYMVDTNMLIDYQLLSELLIKYNDRYHISPTNPEYDIRSKIYQDMLILERKLQRDIKIDRVIDE